MQPKSSAVRIVFEDKTRRVTLSEVTFANLTKIVCDRFNISEPISFGYLDEEDEFIAVGSDQELQFALDHFQRKLKLIAKPSSVVPVPSPAIVPVSKHVQFAPQPEVVDNQVSKEKQVRNSTKTKADEEPAVLTARSIKITSEFFLQKGEEEPIQKKKLVVLPGTKFIKIWKIRNDSQDAWPADTRLNFVEGDQAALKVPSTVRVTSAKPSEEKEVRICGKAPKNAGQFTCIFRFSSNDKAVGRKMKITVVVQEPQGKDPRDGTTSVAKKARREEKDNQEDDKEPKERATRVRNRKPRRDAKPDLD